jgi:hypothetical protein
VVVPASLRIAVAKQRDRDYACGLFAVTTAAHQLGALERRHGATTLLERLDPVARARIEARLSHGGLLEKDVRALAAAAGLYAYRPNTHDAAQFRQPGWLWMARVLVRFTDPASGASYVEKHYVLVLDHLRAEGSLVVADPHPWNPPVYCVDEATFEASWRGSKTKGPPWAAALHRSART